jgi:glutathione synthase/RimK-type ligase-like ATP-grasp enzyme
VNPNLRCLAKACARQNISFETYHHTANVALVAGKHLFVNWSVPLLSHSVARLCTDKEYAYTFLKDKIRMPITTGFLDVAVDDAYSEYLRESSTNEIIERILNDFTLPVIVKRNSGSHGSNVYLCLTQADIKRALNAIFNRSSSEYDYVALVQEYFNAHVERRVILLDGKVSFAYRKDVTGAVFKGNLSPLHWENAKGVLCSREEEARMEQFLAPLFSIFPGLRYVGVDVLEDVDGNLCLIELNGSPGYRVFIRDNGDARVVQMYGEMLEIL